MTSAFLFINAELLFIDDVINKLKEVPEIADVYKVQGIYDIIARVNSDTEEKLKELVSERIRYELDKEYLKALFSYQKMSLKNS